MQGIDVLALAASPLGLLAMALLVYADAFLVVLPGEVAVTAMGAIAQSTGAPPLPLVIAVAAASALAGDASCYAVGRLFARRLRDSARARRALDRAQRELDRRGASVLFTVRFVPFARLAVNLAAGAARTALRRYLPLVAAAALGWAAFQAVLGALLAAILPGGPVVVVIVTVAVALVLGVVVDAVSGLVRRRRSADAADDTTGPPPYSRTKGSGTEHHAMTTEIDDQRALAEIKERLGARFPERSAEEVAAAVDTTYAELSDARVRDFVPVLVEKTAKKRLKAQV